MSLLVKDEAVPSATPTSPSASQRDAHSVDESGVISSEEHTTDDNTAVKAQEIAYNKDYRFWLIMLTLFLDDALFA